MQCDAAAGSAGDTKSQSQPGPTTGMMAAAAHAPLGSYSLSCLSWASAVEFRLKQNLEVRGALWTTAACYPPGHASGPLSTQTAVGMHSKAHQCATLYMYVAGVITHKHNTTNTHVVHMNRPASHTDRA